MTASQVTTHVHRRDRPYGGGAQQFYAPAEPWFTDRLDPVTARGWPGEAVGDPTAVMDHRIPRVEGGRPLSPELRGAVIAIGNFDGFHIGHQAVVDRAVEMARDRGVAAIVATFDPHPIRHFRPDAAPFRLTTLDQRQRLFARAGADAMMVFRFNGALANVTPEHFIRHWLADAGGVVTGDGFSFGRGRTGTVQVFAELAAMQGMAYEAVDTVSLDDGCVSSTRIRDALKQGDCTTAQMLLSRPFTIRGSFNLHDWDSSRHGQYLASIDMEGYLRPRHGSYAVVARLPDGRMFRCTAHIDPSTATTSKQDRLWLTGQHLQDDMQGRAVEVEFMACLSDNQPGSEQADRIIMDVAL
jgi:riboflavin kinase/FMN adenylyltransferase